MLKEVAFHISVFLAFHNTAASAVAFPVCVPGFGLRSQFRDHAHVTMHTLPPFLSAERPTVVRPTFHSRTDSADMFIVGNSLTSRIAEAHVSSHNGFVEYNNYELSGAGYTVWFMFSYASEI